MGGIATSWSPFGLEFEAHPVTWTQGRVQQKTEGFKAILDDELRKAGFASDNADSLFGDVVHTNNANLKIGVLTDDMKGVFCDDCNGLHLKQPSGIVMINANWEIYSALDEKVVFKASTSGGGEYAGKARVILPAGRLRGLSRECPGSCW